MAIMCSDMEVVSIACFLSKKQSSIHSGFSGSCSLKPSIAQDPEEKHTKRKNHVIFQKSLGFAAFFCVDFLIISCYTIK